MPDTAYSYRYIITNLIIVLVKCKNTDSYYINLSRKAKININLIWDMPCLLDLLKLLTSCILSLMVYSSHSDFLALTCPLTLYPVN